MKSYEDIVKFIVSVETDYPVEEWRLNGINVWPIIRIIVTARMMASAGVSGKNQIGKYQNRFYKGLRAIGALVNCLLAISIDRKNNSKITRSDILILAAASNRYFKIQGRWFNPFCDFISDSIKKSKLKVTILETAGDNIYKYPRYNPTMYIQIESTVFQIISILFSRFNYLKVRTKSLPRFNEVSERLEKYSGIRGILSPKFISERIVFLKLMCWYYEKIIKSVQPKVIAFTSYYSIDRMALAVAAKKMRVPTVEIQHGVQGPLHMAYSFWSKIPEGGYEVMPDFFWVWGDDEKNNIDLWCQNNGHDAFIGGNPVICSQFENETRKHFDTLKQKQLMGHEIVLYTVQASSVIDDSLLSAIEFSPPHWLWVFRFHPQYEDVRVPIKNLISELPQKCRIVFDELDQLPLRDLMQAACVHVTEFSSSVIEAEQMGVHSILISEQGRLLFKNQIDRGAASYLIDPRDIVNKISRIISSEKKSGDGLVINKSCPGIIKLISIANG